MKKVIIIYDDTIEVGDRLKTIIGNYSFGNITLKRKKLFSYVSDEVEKHQCEFVKLQSRRQFVNLSSLKDGSIYCHLLASAAICDSIEFGLILDKIKYVKEITAILDYDKPVGFVFPDKEEYLEFVDAYKTNGEFSSLKVNNEINAKCFINIENYGNLLMYISSGFDARYFNSLQGDDYSITKKSKDKKKMKMEYSYYWLLPDEMKNWMVMPYAYEEEGEFASYQMERMPMTDVAIRFTHNAIDILEFRKLLDKTFHFFGIRKEREITKEEYITLADKVYITKVKERLEKLKKCSEYEQLNNFIKNGTEYSGIEDVFHSYYDLYGRVTAKYYKSNKRYTQVIGHGDVFFANMLYSKEINLLRLIDPKGALKEEDLWMNPYYDIAKLSHSICGRYDFFNTNMYDIHVDHNMKMKLTIFFDNSRYKEIFKEFLESNGYDYHLVRLYEASLFLSMLPLHIDNPNKVLGFLLNAIDILKEVEEDV